jgi:hypothetical protein
MLIKEIGHCFHTAIILEDNTGATFLVKNQLVGAQTKHIDVRHHFTREQHEKKDFDVKKHVELAENEWDVLAKNTAEISTNVQEARREAVPSDRASDHSPCPSITVSRTPGPFLKLSHKAHNNNNDSLLC